MRHVQGQKPCYDCHNATDQHFLKSNIVESTTGTFTFLVFVVLCRGKKAGLAHVPQRSKGAVCVFGALVVVTLVPHPRVMSPKRCPEALVLGRWCSGI